MKKRRVAVNDLMQSNYVYFCTEPAGQKLSILTSSQNSRPKRCWSWVCLAESI